jgi:isoleucyl-tRNA synthetase
VLDRFPGAALDGVRYEPPFAYLGRDVYGERGHTVLLADFVSADDGTGLVHTAVAFGEDDFQLGVRYGLNVVNPVRLDGTYDERIGKYAGRFVKDADQDLIEELRTRGRLLRAEDKLHSYPFCWRSGDPLIYYAKPAWYIATSKAARQAHRVERGGQLVPRAHQARALRQLAGEQRRLGAVARALLGHAAARLALPRGPRPRRRLARRARELSGVHLEDPHRPYVDDVGFACPQCHQRMTRVPEVIDVWFDSGAMPFAQWHAPMEHEDRFGARFPADFICEAIDQTRGWFYSLLAISTLLFDRSSYENVVCLGHIRDKDDKKMSKSLGNIVPPWDVLDRFGADAFAGTSSPPSSRGRATASTSRRSARASGCSSSRCGTRTRSTSCTRTSTTSRCRPRRTSS